MVSAVAARRLRRVYRSRQGATETVALYDVDLVVGEGEVHGLLGPNGAGKTTLVKILATLLIPTSGSAEVLGHDVVSDARLVRTKVGVVFGGERGLYNRVTARRNLEFWSALYHQDRRTARIRCAQVLDRMGLSDCADTPVEKFSRGMKQRLHLARGLLHDPQVLFLDEPTSGMDPSAAHSFRDLVRELQAEGRTIFLTTHDMAEAEALCDRVTLIDHGQLILSEPTTQVRRHLSNRECVDFTCADAGVIGQLRDLPCAQGLERRADVPDGWRVFPGSAADTAELLVWLIRRNVLSARVSEPTLADVYLDLVGTRGMLV
jgi:ABC-2 type transport system ATP-binding protein